MDVKKEAYNFAVLAYSTKYRKAELDKPFVFHAIDVANKLDKYDFDDNVIAAGYLHDIIEDTVYSKEDILKIFGEDITSLVVGATEENKNLSWEERKIGSINRVKNLDIRHKAVVTCDKISNIEDLKLKFGKEGKEDFTSFNRGKSKKNWYWKESYKSLITGENVGIPMFVSLEKNISDICNFSDILNNGYYSDIDVIDASLNKSNIARELYYKKKEILKITSLMPNRDSCFVQFINSNFNDDMMCRLKAYFAFSDFNVLYSKDLKFLKENIDKISNIYDLVLIDNDKIINYADMVIDSKNNDLLSVTSNIIDNMRNKILKRAEYLYIDKNEIKKLKRTK